MEIPITQLPPGDPRLIDAIVGQLKSKGIFDRFRKECLADVDTKPAFLNLRQRVDGQVKKFLDTKTWKNDLNKNQLRDGVRKNIQESGILDSGIDAIINQVVNPKIKPLILPLVEDTVYGFLQIEKPKREIQEFEGQLPPVQHVQKPFYGYEAPVPHQPYPPYPVYQEIPPPFLSGPPESRVEHPPIPLKASPKREMSSVVNEQESSNGSESEISIEEKVEVKNFEEAKPLSLPGPGLIPPDILPMETDVISSGEDDILARASPQSQSSISQEQVHLPVKMEEDNAVDSFDTAMAGTDVTSAVEKLTLKEDKTKSVETTEERREESEKDSSMACLPLFDNQSLDSISSNTSGLSFSPNSVTKTSQGQASLTQQKVEGPEESSLSKSMEDLRSTQSTPLVDEKTSSQGDSASSQPSKSWPSYTLPKHLPSSERVTIAAFGPALDGSTPDAVLPSAKVVEGASPVSAEDSQGSLDGGSSSTEKVDAEALPKVPKPPKSDKSEGEITTSSSSSSSSPPSSFISGSSHERSPKRSSQHRPSFEREKSRERRAGSGKLEGHHSSRSGHGDSSSRRDRSNERRHSRDSDRKSKSRHDDHSSYRNRDKHHRRDKDDDKDRDRHGKSHSSSHVSSSGSAGRSTTTEAGSRDKRDKGSERSSDHKSHSKSHHSSSHSKSHSSQSSRSSGSSKHHSKHDSRSSDKHDIKYDKKSEGKHTESKRSEKEINDSKKNKVKDNSSKDVSKPSSKKEERTSENISKVSSEKEKVSEEKILKKDSTQRKENISKTITKSSLEKESKDLENSSKTVDKVPSGKEKVSEDKNSKTQSKAFSGKESSKSVHSTTTEKTKEKNTPSTKPKPVKKSILKDDDIFELHLSNNKKNVVLPKPTTSLNKFSEKKSTPQKPVTEIKETTKHEKIVASPTDKVNKPKADTPASAKTITEPLEENNNKAPLKLKLTLNGAKKGTKRTLGRSRAATRKPRQISTSSSSSPERSLDESSDETLPLLKKVTIPLFSISMSNCNLGVPVNVAEQNVLDQKNPTNLKNKLIINQGNVSDQGVNNLAEVSSKITPQSTRTRSEVTPQPDIVLNNSTLKRKRGSTKVVSHAFVNSDSDSDSSSSSSRILAELFGNSSDESDFEGFNSPKVKKVKKSKKSLPVKRLLPLKQLKKSPLKKQLVVVCDDSSSSDMEMSIVNFCQKSGGKKELSPAMDFEGFKDEGFEDSCSGPDQKLKDYLAQFSLDTTIRLNDFIQYESEDDDEEGLGSTVFSSNKNTTKSVIEEIAALHQNKQPDILRSEPGFPLVKLVEFASEEDEPSSELDTDLKANNSPVTSTDSDVKVESDIKLTSALTPISEHDDQSSVEQSFPSLGNTRQEVNLSEMDSRKPLKKRKLSGLSSDSLSSSSPSSKISRKSNGMCSLNDKAIEDFASKDLAINSYSLLTPEEDRSSSKDYDMDISQRTASYIPLSPASDSSSEEIKTKLINHNHEPENTPTNSTPLPTEAS